MPEQIILFRHFFNNLFITPCNNPLPEIRHQPKNFNFACDKKLNTPYS